MDSGGFKETCFVGPQIQCEGGNYWGNDMPGHVQRHSAVSFAKMDEPIDLPFGLWIRVGRRKRKFNRIRQVALTRSSPGEYD